MKDLNLLVWLTQLGISVAVPLAGFILLAVWLQEKLQWGNWVIWVGVVMGVLSAISGLRSSLKMLNRLGKRPNDPQPPAVSFNEHD